ncbi:MAG: hypothetical protein HKP61_11715 [Dactylosporangium sp.]|nr:hypothetical protein [Dactylosporangium sp.]NNJ61590.1 hypothetical protein [Dactylosporangium sp.]
MSHLPSAAPSPSTADRIRRLRTDYRSLPFGVLIAAAFVPMLAAISFGTASLGQSHPSRPPDLAGRQRHRVVLDLPTTDPGVPITSGASPTWANTPTQPQQRTAPGRRARARLANAAPAANYGRAKQSDPRPGPTPPPTTTAPGTPAPTPAASSTPMPSATATSPHPNPHVGPAEGGADSSPRSQLAPAPGTTPGTTGSATPSPSTEASPSA